MDAKSRRGAPGIPVDEWYPAIAARPKPNPRNARWRLVAAATAVIVTVGGLGTVIVLGLDRHQPSNTASATVPPAPAGLGSSSHVGIDPPADTGVDPCRGLKGGLVTYKPGGQDNPMNVVAALEYAYYVKRDTNAVTSLYAANVLDSTAIAGITDFISSIPVGTKYCVAATVVDPATNTVNYDINELRPTQGTEIPPHAVPTTYAMALTVTSSAPFFISNLHPRK